jgi:hypothetical protein
MPPRPRCTRTSLPTGRLHHLDRSSARVPAPVRLGYIFYHYNGGLLFVSHLNDAKYIFAFDVAK